MKNKVRIFLFADALGAEIVERYDFMKKELPFRYPLRTQLGYSSTAVPTILSGVSPEQHGHFSFFYYDRNKRSPFRFFRAIAWMLHPDFFWNNHRIRHRISELLKKIYGFSGYFNLYHVPYSRLPYFDYCEKSDIFAKNGLAPVDNLRDMLEKSPISDWHISDWRKSDDFNLREAVSLLNQERCEFLFIYSAGLDGMLHFHVRDDEYVKKSLQAFREKVEEIRNAAQAHYRDVQFFLFSDHGMTPLAEEVDLKTIFESDSRFRFGRDYVVCYDSTMLRVWFLNPNAKEPMMNLLRPRDGNGTSSSAALPGHWLSPEEKRFYRVDFSDSKYGDEIFLLNPGSQIVPSDMGNKAIPGMHGFSPDHADSEAVLLSDRDLIFRPRDIGELFTLMRKEAYGESSENNRGNN